MQENDQHGPAENIAHREITAIRNILLMSSRQNAAWLRLTRPERLILCKTAKIPALYACSDWEKIPIPHQNEIRSAAIRASEWAKTLNIK